MHAALLADGKSVVFLDKVEGPTQAAFPNGEPVVASEFSLITNTAQPLQVSTNAFCSSGSFLPDGTLVNFGGDDGWLNDSPTVGQGLDSIRTLAVRPCTGTRGTRNGPCDWQERRVSGQGRGPDAGGVSQW